MSFVVIIPVVKSFERIGASRLLTGAGAAHKHRRAKRKRRQPKFHKYLPVQYGYR